MGRQLWAKGFTDRRQWADMDDWRQLMAYKLLAKKATLSGYGTRERQFYPNDQLYLWKRLDRRCSTKARSAAAQTLL